MAKYYGVVGNRDHIKLEGIKHPFWEFLDEQPDGYLTSLAYFREDLPNSHMIFDCGAWSYRNDAIPPVTPEKAYEKYTIVAESGDFCIAPDHMLIPDVDLVSRRQFNIDSAKRFLSVIRNELVPMATIHGMDTEERVENAKRLKAMGYNHLAIGGVAARASQKKLVLETVQLIRDVVPDVWLHVLGLSSPAYAAEWNRMGIQSFDGSSHFKQAFTGGVFFTVENGKLKKWQAARPSKGDEISAPECRCSACDVLMRYGIDTRSFGSNEHNMGRAAHNMNMLMKAQKIAVGGTTVLVSCVGKKVSSAKPAKYLYQSEWFKKARRWAENNGDRWFILSAEHGLLNPEKVIEPYEKTLNTMDVYQRRVWGEFVSSQINKLPPCTMVILAGEKYREFLNINHSFITPMEGMGIGQQLAWLKQQNSKQGDLFDD